MSAQQHSVISAFTKYNVTKVYDDNFHLFFSFLGYYAGVVASSMFIGRTAAW